MGGRGGVDLPSCAVPSRRGKLGADLRACLPRSPFHHSAAATVHILAGEREVNERTRFTLAGIFSTDCGET